MLKAKMRWKVKETDEQLVNELSEQLGIYKLTATLLVNRGIRSAEAAYLFLHPEQYDYHDPFFMKGMRESVSRIKRALKNGERILIFGDYDADGVTSTALMVHLLRHYRADFLTYIPNRFTEGYGPNEAAFRWAKEQGVSLIITVDTGISAVYEVEIANQLGMDVIITDHHEPPESLPDAYAIINPKQPGCAYPFKGLAGVGVAFKLAHAILGAVPEQWLDLAAIGTIADLAPLRDENRKIARVGLKKLQASDHVGLKALLQVCRIIEKDLTAEHIGFAVAPRLNAAGRLDSAELALHLLISTDEVEAKQRAEEIERLNRERQTIVTETTEEALSSIAEKGLDGRVLVVAKSGWNPGVLGIVASRLVERFSRPVIVLTIDEESQLAEGSARSMEGYDLFSNLTECRHLLTHFGGHTMAAGLTLPAENIETLRTRLNEFAEKQLDDADFIHSTMIDGSCSLGDVSIEAIEELEKLAPFGVDNAKPTFLFEKVTLSQLRKIGSELDHLKIQLTDSDFRLDGIGFRLGDLFHEVTIGSDVSVVGELSINEWNGFRKPQLIVKDMKVNEWQLFDYRGVSDLHSRLSQLPKENVTFVSFQEKTIESLQLRDFSVNIVNPKYDDAQSVTGSYIVLLDLPDEEKQLADWYRSIRNVERTYAVFHHPESQYFTSVPTREQFKWYYAFLRKRKSFHMKDVHKLATYKGWSEETIKWMSRVFLELGFVTINHGLIAIVEHPVKQNLQASASYRRKSQMIQLEKIFLYSSYQSLKSRLQQFRNSPTCEEALN